MGRPKRVFPNKLHEFDKLHTRKVKMYAGTEITGLHIVKETDQYYLSIDSWCHCCGPFKNKKKNFNLEYKIPVIKNTKTLEFLKEHCWADWADRQIKAEDSDIIETVNFLNRLFPNHKKLYFYELDSLITQFCHGSFIEYDENKKNKKTHRK